MDENAAPEYQGHAWADAFGIWFARVPRTCVSPLIVARRLLRDELTPRDNGCAREVWLHPVRIPAMDTAGTIVYMEGPAHDWRSNGDEMVTEGYHCTRCGTARTPEGEHAACWQ